MPRSDTRAPRAPTEDPDRPPPVRVHGTTSQIQHDEIAERAYELYLARGSNDGHAIDDWLEAEQMLRLRRGRRTTEPEEKPH